MMMMIRMMRMSLVMCTGYVRRNILWYYFYS
jgi:hypothetical protein